MTREALEYGRMREEQSEACIHALMAIRELAVEMKAQKIWELVDQRMEDIQANDVAAARASYSSASSLKKLETDR